MESDKRNQNLDSTKEKDLKTNQNPDSDHKAEESKAPESTADSKPVVVGEQKPNGRYDRLLWRVQQEKKS